MNTCVPRLFGRPVFPQEMIPRVLLCFAARIVFQIDLVPRGRRPPGCR